MTFQRVLLGEVAEITVGHVGSMADEYVATGVPFLRSLNIEPYRVSTTDMKFISPGFHGRLKKSALHPGDVVIVRTGKPGTCAVVPAWLGTANCSDLVIVRCGPSIEPRYLSYWVNSLASHHIDSNLVGAVQQHFNVGAAKQMPVLLPSCRQQGQILEVLASLDEKIELNRRMNVTLEAMSQAIFRDWFVDFGPVRRKQGGATHPVEIMGGLAPDRAAELAALFPSAFADDGIPAGWRRFVVNDLAKLSRGAVSPMVTPEVLFEHFSLPAFDSGQQPALDLGSTIKSNKTLVPEGAVLLSKLNPEISRVWLPETQSRAPQIASTEFLVFQPSGQAGRSLLFCLFSDPSFRQMLEGRVTGTSKSHQRISPSGLMETEALSGSGPCFGAFEGLCAPMMGRVLSVRAESRALAETRDYLLPRLMSGELRVRNLEREPAA